MAYARSFEEYWGAGWHGLLWVPKTTTWKRLTLRGYSGYDGVYPSYADVVTWAEDHADDNIALRMPPNVIGIDVDHYGEKRGGDTFTRAIAEWGPLPDTVISTSRVDGVSGIRLYRVPEGTHLATIIEFPDEGLGNIEIVQRHHRYAMVWPSEHVEGRTYRWADSDWNVVGVPRVDDLPMLPEPWIKALSRDPADTSVSANVEQVLAGLPEGDMDEKVRRILSEGIVELVGNPSSHFECTRDLVGRLLRLAEQKHTGTRQARDILRAAYCKAVADKRDGRSEYDRMWTSQRIHDLIASSPTISGAQHNAELAALAGLVTEEQKRDFWQARPELQTIHEFARARRVPPWGVLGSVIAQVLASVPVWVQLPPIRASEASLNFVCVLAARSGGGKDSSAKVGKKLYPTDVDTVNLGSGEGVAKTYMEQVPVQDPQTGKPTKVMKWVYVRTSALFYTSEGDLVSSTSSRGGSTLIPILRKAAFGEDLEMANRASDTRIPVKEGEYRFVAITAIQLKNSGWLFADSDGGLLQRSVWFLCEDSDAPQVRPPMPDCTVLPTIPQSAWSAGGGGLRSNWVIGVPDEVWREIDALAVADLHGRSKAFDTHRTLIREKVAFALHVLSCAWRGVTDMDELKLITSEDWELSGVIMSHSDNTRDRAWDELKDANRKALRGAAKSKAEVEAEVAEVVEGERIQKAKIRILEKLGAGVDRRRALLQGWKGAARKEVAEPALDALIEDGIVVENEGVLSVVDQG